MEKIEAMSTSLASPDSMASLSPDSMEKIDVLVVGCGISGISAAYHISKHCRGTTFAVLERRAKLGGTWSFFKYPGIRTDSDVFSFGFGWKRWESDNIVAPAKDICQYLDDAVDEHGLRQHIRLNTDVVSASFSSATQRWTVTTGAGGTIVCRFLILTTGYYQYEKPHMPAFDGSDRFQGTFVHSQQWPESLDVAGKRVIVIGSGATAVTMVPALIDRGAASVVMLQRSPSYYYVAPKHKKDRALSVLERLFGARIGYFLQKWLTILQGAVVYAYAQWFRAAAKQRFIAEARKLCPDHVDADTHFSPSYGVWDQRLCLDPDGSLFAALRTGRASVVTDHVARFVESGVCTGGGEVLEADIVVSATGLTLQHNFPMSTMKVSVDGVPYDAPNHFVFRGCMLSGVPNLFYILGYTNASWTLRADMMARYFCDMINYCGRHGMGMLCPCADGVEESQAVPFNLSSGYVTRNRGRFPKLGGAQPWGTVQSFFSELWRFKVRTFSELQWIKFTPAAARVAAGA